MKFCENGGRIACCTVSADVTVYSYDSLRYLCRECYDVERFLNTAAATKDENAHKRSAPKGTWA